MITSPCDAIPHPGYSHNQMFEPVKKINNGGSGVASNLILKHDTASPASTASIEKEQKLQEMQALYSKLW